MLWSTRDLAAYAPMKHKTLLQLREAKWAFICVLCTGCLLAGMTLTILPWFGIRWLALIESRTVEVLLGVSMAISGTYSLLGANHQRFAAHRELIDLALAAEDAAQTQNV